MPKPSLDTAKVDAILVGAKPDEFEEILRSLDIFERGGTMSREEADIWRTRVQGWVRYRREDPPGDPPQARHPTNRLYVHRDCAGDSRATLDSVRRYQQSLPRTH